MAVVESLNTGNSASGNIQYLFDEQKKDATIADVYSAVSGKSETLYQRILKVDGKLDSILTSINKSNTYLASMDANSMFGSSGGDHAAILAVELDATGDARAFMNSLEKISQLDSISLVSVADGLDSMGISLDKILKKDFSKVEPILSSLEAFSGGLTKFSSSLPSFKQLASVAGGVAVIGLAVASFATGISISDVVSMGLVFGGIALASKLLHGTSTNLIKASLGVATMGLSIWAFNQVVDTNELLQFGTSLLTLGASILLYDRVFGTSTMNVGKSLLAMSLGVGALGIAMMPFNFVQWESIAKASAAVGGIGVASLLLKSVKMDSVYTLAALSGSVGVLGLSLKLYDEISLGDVGVALAALGGVTAIAMVMSKLGKNTLIGAAAIGATGGAMAIMAYGLERINGIDMTWDDAVRIASTIGITAAAFAALGIPVVAGLIGIGALAAIGMGAALATISVGLNSISDVEVTPDQANRFGESITNLKDVMVGIGSLSELPSLILGIANAALITGATLPLVLAANMVSKVENPSEAQLLGFSSTISSLKDTFTQFGILDLAELAAVAPIMLLMATTTVAFGGAISLFTKLSTTPESARGAVGTLDAFLSGIYTTYSAYDDDAFEVLGKGIDATLGLGKLLRNLALGIGAISKEMDKNTDFTAIGTSVGSMLSALTEPLAAIGGTNDEISIGGFKITNPFSNKVAKGVEALSGLTNIFMPLSEMIKVFSADTNGDIVGKFKTNITGILGSLGEVFSSFSDQGSNPEELDVMFSATDKASSFVKTVTEANYDPASKGLKNIAGSTKEMQVAINDMDLDKLTKLNDLFHNMNALDDSDGLEMLLESLRDLVEAMASSNPTTTQEGDNSTIVNNQSSKEASAKVSANDEDSIDIAGLISQSNGDVVEVMRELTDYIKGGQLKVTMKKSII